MTNPDENCWIHACLLFFDLTAIFQLSRDGSSWVKLVQCTEQRAMCFAQGHSKLNAVVPERLKLESLSLESSTLALSHCASVFFFITTMVGRTFYMYWTKKKKAYTKCSSQIYVYTYAFIIHVTEYERLEIKIPVEGSCEFYLHFIPPLCLIFFKI